MSFLDTLTFTSGLPVTVQASALPTRKPRSKARKRTLRTSTSTLLIDRVEAAIDDGRIDLCDEDMPCESLDLTLAELALLLEILFPEEYGLRPRRRATKGSPTAPGSGDRVAEYARRRAAGLAIHSTADAKADGPGRGMRIVQRANGSGVKVIGWEDEET